MTDSRRMATALARSTDANTPLGVLGPPPPPPVTGTLPRQKKNIQNWSVA